jgi:NADH-quinone oxidoreductase subunit F
MAKIHTTKDLEDLRNKILKDREKFRATLVICGGTGCQASRSRDVIDAIQKELDNHGLNGSICLRTTGCHGFCEQGPLIVIEPGNLFYCHVSPDDVHEIISKTILKNEIIERLLYTDPISGKLIKTESEISFYRSQDRQILAQNRQVDPCSIEIFSI